MELRSQKDIELHVEDVRKKDNQIKIRDKEYKLSGPDTRKRGMIKYLKIKKRRI